MKAQRYHHAGKGLGVLFWSEIALLASFLLALIPLAGGMLSVLAVTVAGIGGFYGVWLLRNAHPHYMHVIYISFVSLALMLLDRFLLTDGLWGGLVDIACATASFLGFYFMCTATADLLVEKGNPALAARGRLIWKLSGAARILDVLLGWMPLAGTILTVAGYAILTVDFVVKVLLLIFYYRSSRCLLA